MMKPEETEATPLEGETSRTEKQPDPATVPQGAIVLGFVLDRDLLDVGTFGGTK